MLSSKVSATESRATGELDAECRRWANEAKVSIEAMSCARGTPCLAQRAGSSIEHTKRIDSHLALITHGDDKMKNLAVVITFCGLLLAANLANAGHGLPGHYRLNPDGVIVLEGVNGDIAGIEAISTSGYLLGLKAVNTGIPGFAPDNQRPFVNGDPFPLGTPVSNVGGGVNGASDVATLIGPAGKTFSVALGVLGATKRVSAGAGPVETSILYDVAHLGDAATDLSVSVGIGSNSPLAFPIVPEPASALLAVFGVLGLLGFRRRR